MNPQLDTYRDLNKGVLQSYTYKNQKIIENLPIGERSCYVPASVAFCPQKEVLAGIMCAVEIVI